jgi:nucleoside-diphosphate-sugar epimerase
MRPELSGHLSPRVASLITGASGFIGQHLCRTLRDEGHEVHATSRRLHASKARGPHWHQADLADLAVARRLFATVKPEVVCHLAGAVGASPDLELVLPTFHSLLTSTINVLVAATEAGCRRIVLSGSLTEPQPGPGATPQSPYAAAKWAASCYGRMFQSLYDAPVVILRPSMSYGPGQAAAKLVPSVTLSLLRGERPMLASGKTLLDWVYIADVIDGFIAAAAAPGIEGETIDLGSGTLVSTSDIARRLVRIVGKDLKPEFGALPDRPNEPAVPTDTSVAARRLGWRATTPLDEGLRRTVDWYRAMIGKSLASSLCHAGALAALVL